MVFSEKVKAGAALADFNNNGRDDIVIGTDDNHIYLILDDGSIAPGFPFLADDKIQSAPSILKYNNEKIIFDSKVSIKKFLDATKEKDPNIQKRLFKDCRGVISLRK